jgi:hypothetical protein
VDGRLGVTRDILQDRQLAGIYVVTPSVPGGFESDLAQLASEAVKIGSSHNRIQSQVISWKYITSD